jgi:hypothetical protein
MWPTLMAEPSKMVIFYPNLGDLADGSLGAIPLDLVDLIRVS